MSITTRIIGITAMLALLSACGQTTGQRAVSGGAIGAGAGAVGGALIGGDPLTGALIGGGVGAATGAFTNPHQVNLGRFPRF